MDKIVEELNAVRSSVKSWETHAESLLSGAAVRNEQRPVLPTACYFGQWYYNAGAAFKDLPAYARLEIPHDNQHILYKRIFDLLVTDDVSDQSTFGSFFGKAKAMKEERKQEAAKLFSQLRQLNIQLIDLIDLLEGQIKDSGKVSVPAAAEKPKVSKFSEVNKILESLDDTLDKG